MMFMPKIIGFICNWSLPVEVNTASPRTINGYPKIRIVRVMCVGRIDPAIVLETFAEGADGVLIVGCRPPNCHYIEGNLHAERKIKMLTRLVSRTGLEPERLRLDWTCAPEIKCFAKVIDDFRNEVATLGPSPLTGERPDTNILLNIKVAKAAAEDFRLRVLIGRERELTEKQNTYRKKISQEKFDNVMDTAIEAEYLRNKIYLLVKNGPMSVIDLSKYLDLPPREVLRHIVVLRRRGLLALEKIEGEDPLYIALEAI